MVSYVVDRWLAFCHASGFVQASGIVRSLKKAAQTAES